MPRQRANGRPSERMKRLADIASARRLVLKIGSSLLVQDGVPRSDWLASLVGEIIQLRMDGCGVIVVSSGAIALGAATLGFERGGRASLADAQAAASVGQVALARLWSEALESQSATAAQMLVTLADLEDRRRYLNAAATLGRLLDAGAVPVVNENDSVATEEIRFGDNDRLAARVAQAANADAIVLLSDVDGLFDSDPGGAGAQLVSVVDGITPEILAMAGSGSGSGLGSGGMASKLEAAQIAERAGLPLAIVNGTYDAPLSRAFERDRGTLFLPQRHDDARKAWLGGRLAPEGTLTVDSGCAAALQNGASLLAAGLSLVEGDFRRGDLVEIVDSSGNKLAQGLVEYDATECHAIAGMGPAAQAGKLGHAPRSAVVHRNHMVLS